MQTMMERLQQATVAVRTGEDFDDWDLELRGGFLGGVRTLMAIEEHGSGRQMVRFRVWPKFSLTGMVLGALCVVLAGAAALDNAWAVALLLALGGLLVFARASMEYATVAGKLQKLLREECDRSTA